eukprot:m.40168 g.40168  ORF g.40168 m.40168 type:complete len:1446 (-) comp11342_c0_seq1:160-4497(-)
MVAFVVVLSLVSLSGVTALLPDHLQPSSDPEGGLKDDNALALALTLSGQPNTLFKQEAGVGTGKLPNARLWQAAEVFELKQFAFGQDQTFQILVMFGGLGGLGELGSLPLSDVFSDTWLLDVNHANRSPRWWPLPLSVTGTAIGARCGHAMATLTTLALPYGIASKQWQSSIPILFGGTTYGPKGFPLSEQLSDTNVWAFNFAALETLPLDTFFRLYNLGEEPPNLKANLVWQQVDITSADNPAARKFHTMNSMIVDGAEFIIMFGGATLDEATSACISDCIALNETWKLQVNADTASASFTGVWTRVTTATTPPGRFGHAAAQYNNILYVAGGMGRGSLTGLWSLQATFGAELDWTAMGTPLTQPLMFGSAGILLSDTKPMLHIVGGISNLQTPSWGPDHTTTNTIYEYYDVFVGETAGVQWCVLEATGCKEDLMTVPISTPPLNSVRASGLFGTATAVGKWQTKGDEVTLDLPEVLLVFGGASSIAGDIYPRGDLFTASFAASPTEANWEWRPPLDGPQAQSKGALAATRTLLDNEYVNALWLFGGVTQALEPLGSLWQFYGTDKFTWQGVSLAYESRPSARFGHTFVPLQNGGLPAHIVLLFGGLDNVVPSGQTICGLGGSTPPCDPCIVYSTERNGQAPTGLSLLGDIWEFDSQSLRWAQLNPTTQTQGNQFPVCRAYHQAAVINNLMFIYGGITNINNQYSEPYIDDWYPVFGPCSSNCQRYVLGDLWMFQYNPKSGHTWTYIPPSTSFSASPAPRMSLGMSAAGNSILVFGGKSYQPAQPGTIGTLVTTNDAWILQIPEGTSIPITSTGIVDQDPPEPLPDWMLGLDEAPWVSPSFSPTSDKPKPRFGHFCVALGTSKFACAAGWGKSPNSTSVTWPTGVYVLSPVQRDTASTNASNLTDMTTQSPSSHQDEWGWLEWPGTSVSAGLSMVAATGVASQEATLLVNFGGLQQGNYSYSSPDFTSFSFQCEPGQGVSLSCIQNVKTQQGFLFDCDCEPCAAGTYSPNGAYSCSQCPGDAWTASSSSQSRDACKLCNPTACNNHGRCDLVGGVTAQCSCRWGWAGDRCDIEYGTAVILLVAVCVVGTAIGAFVWSSRNKQKEGKLKFEKEATRQLLIQQQQENFELIRAWQIEESEIVWKKRIDDNVGTTGEVWMAEWKDYTVAVKKLHKALMELDESTIAIFEREVYLMRKLRHSNLVLFLGAGFTAPDEDQRRIPYIVLEYCGGGSWHDRLHRTDNEIPLGTRLKWALDAAKGMEFLHGLDPCRLHRDFKPHNCLLSQAGVLKVADLGSLTTLQDSGRTTASNVSESSETLRHAPRQQSLPYTSVFDPFSGEIVGTPAYMAPEVFLARDYSTASDVFAYGISLWQNLERNLPFAQVRHAVGEQIADGLRPTVSSQSDPVAAEYVDLMKLCWHEAPHMRPSFAQICERLTSLILRAQLSDC